MKLEEKVRPKEEETSQLQARKQEKKEAEIKQLRRNLNFKATLMPAFYREPGRRSEENKDGQSWEKAGARAAVRGRWRMDRKREILDVLRAKPVIFCVETRRNTPMPAFYREPGRRSEENKDGQSWEEAGARAAVRGRWRMDRKREILDVLRAKPVIFCVETRSNTPMPAFYREPGRRSEENKDGQSWEEAGARAAVRGRWRMDQKREILDVLRAKPVIFCVETRFVYKLFLLVYGRSNHSPVILLKGGDGFFNEILNGLLLSRHKCSYPPSPTELNHPIENNGSGLVLETNVDIRDPSDSGEDESPLLKQSTNLMYPELQEPEKIPAKQADSWQFGSISFGRFENEVLCWERRSSFTQNRYLEEVEKCIKPGSVTEKRAYFEELFRRRALLSQSSSDCQDGVDSQASNDGFKNTDYEGDFEHVNEIGHSSCFVENHDRAATLLENGKYQASENEGYAGRLEHVNEVGHSARFDENYDSSTNLSKNGKYQDDNTGYGGDSERVNEVSSGSKVDVRNQHKSTEEQPLARKVVASRASCTERVSHRLYQSVHRDKESVNSRKPVVKQNGSSFCFKTEERARKRKEARTNFLCLLDKVQMSYKT
ncbi:hypothetical protein CQW23_33967 [Capsicum baccatum]|uniref:TPX2 C-terminal domain-containing protein n=1 Tax=Capsicum baccatum TaxID=33114 RepID=A0A2G2V071_CAPBA|nr:hypothetical protein CQW23_33967 [Capsicum baccatum]